MPMFAKASDVFPVPSLEDFREPHETLICFADEKPDKAGRRYFMAYWLADNVGRRMNERGIAGQVFFTQPEKFVERHFPTREFA